MKEKFIFYTIDEVAEMLKVHPMTIRRLIWKGKLKPVKVGTYYRISLQELKRFMEENRK